MQTQTEHSDPPRVLSVSTLPGPAAHAGLRVVSDPPRVLSVSTLPGRAAHTGLQMVPMDLNSSSSFHSHSQ